MKLNLVDYCLVNYKKKIGNCIPIYLIKPLLCIEFLAILRTEVDFEKKTISTI